MRAGIDVYKGDYGGAALSMAGIIPGAKAAIVLVTVGTAAARAAKVLKAAKVAEVLKAAIGMTDDAARFAALSSRADHAMRHLVAKGVIAGTANSTIARNGWGNLVSNVLTRPTKSFNYVLKGVKTRGFYKVVDGHDVVLFVTKHNHGGVLQGQVIGGWVPTKALNPDIMKLIGK